MAPLAKASNPSKYRSGSGSSSAKFIFIGLVLVQVYRLGTNVIQIRFGYISIKF